MSQSIYDAIYCNSNQKMHGQKRVTPTLLPMSDISLGNPLHFLHLFEKSCSRQSNHAYDYPRWN